MKKQIVKSLGILLIFCIVAYIFYVSFATSPPKQMQVSPAMVDKAQMADSGIIKPPISIEVADSVSKVENSVSNVITEVLDKEPPQEKPTISQDVTTPPKEYLTIQVFSFKTLDQALSGYEQVEIFLSQADRNQLRVEHVQNFYTVRVGKFNATESGQSQQAHDLLDKLQVKFKTSLLLSAYVIEERIRKVYQSEPQSIRNKLQVDKDDLVQVPDKKKESYITTEIVPKEIVKVLRVALPEPIKRTEPPQITDVTPVIDKKKVN